MVFSTASGRVPTQQQIAVRIDEFDQGAEPYVLLETPSVLSLGCRCKKGFTFIWRAHETPYFI